MEDQACRYADQSQARNGFPLIEHESKELISPVLPYATPALLGTVDPVVHFSEGHRSDMLLGVSGLTREERFMVQASVNNERDFDKVAEALIIQRQRIHLRKRRKRAKGKGKYGINSNGN